eukprot:TRINITY_DN268_c0_g1_i4.p1 TRINITY_DN268_c0_g1~~TRINITY_DN268_c0_g1_i4.p1  ORF type:complete len:410 (-),score=64.57 TRINITY_DN268_c0_g1_i4:288-1517(-)
MVHILIVGGGIGGLCLAQGLRKAGISFTVFERDPSKEFRPQGYRIRIKPTGSCALRNCLTPELYDLFEKSCGIFDLGGVSMDPISGASRPRPANPPPTMNDNPENAPNFVPNKVHVVDRTILRYLLSIGLEDSIQYGKEFKSYKVLDNGKVEVSFSDGTVVQGDLLVGADGARSRVRKQLAPDQIIVDTTGRCIYGKTPLTPEFEKELNKECLVGMCMATTQEAPPLALLFETIRFEKEPKSLNDNLPFTPDYVYWVLGSSAKKFCGDLNAQDFLSLSKDKAVDLALKVTESWREDIRAVFRHCVKEQCSTIAIASAIPDLPSWPFCGVTLIGDSIHVMSPTGGVGADTALRDAALLCSKIQEGITAESIGKYEEMMRFYSKQAIISSARGGSKLFGQPDFKDCEHIKL